MKKGILLFDVLLLCSFSLKVSKAINIAVSYPVSIKEYTGNRFWNTRTYLVRFYTCTYLIIYNITSLQQYK